MIRPLVEVLEGRLLLTQYLWVGNTQGKPQFWSDPDHINWQDKLTRRTLTIPPGSSDDVWLTSDSNGSGTDSVVDTGFSGTVNSIHILNGYSWTLRLATTLTVAGSSPPTSEITGATISPTVGTAQTLTVLGPLNWTGGTITGNLTLKTVGTTTVSPGQGPSPIVDNATWSNSGTANISVVQGVAPVLDVKNAGAITNRGTMTVNGFITTSDGTGSATNNKVLTIPTGSLTTGTFQNTGTFEVDTFGVADFLGAATQTGQSPTTDLAGGGIKAQGANGYEVQAGSLYGDPSGATITGNLTNSGGTVYPGGLAPRNMTGTLTVSGNYTQGSSGTLWIDVNYGAKTNTQLIVTGTASLAGTLYVNFTGAPYASKWPIIPYGQIMGDFTAKQTSGPSYIRVPGDPNKTYMIEITPPAGGGRNFGAVEGNAFSGVVANFTDPSFTNFTAAISWGDGSTSTASTADGSISTDGAGGWNVNGTHTYADEGSDPIAVAVVPMDDPSDPATFTSTATVADAPLGNNGSATGVNGTATVGVPFSGVVATFTDANPNATAADFQATINWTGGSNGDSGSDPGIIRAGSGGTFEVVWSHVFTQPASAILFINIQDDGGSSAVASATITVTGSSLASRPLRRV